MSDPYDASSDSGSKDGDNADGQPVHDLDPQVLQGGAETWPTAIGKPTLGRFWYDPEIRNWRPTQQRRIAVWFVMDCPFYVP